GPARDQRPAVGIDDDAQAGLVVRPAQVCGPLQRGPVGAEDGHEGVLAPAAAGLIRVLHVEVGAVGRPDDVRPAVPVEGDPETEVVAVSAEQAGPDEAVAGLVELEREGGLAVVGGGLEGSDGGREVVGAGAGGFGAAGNVDEAVGVDGDAPGQVGAVHAADDGRVDQDVAGDVQLIDEHVAIERPGDVDV